MTIHTHLDTRLLAELRADASVLDSHLMVGDGAQAPGAIVLRKLDAEFVVHFANLQTGGYHSGWYIADASEARQAYAERCKRYDPTGTLHRAAAQRQVIETAIQRSCDYTRAREAYRCDACGTPTGPGRHLCGACDE